MYLRNCKSELTKDFYEVFGQGGYFQTQENSGIQARLMTGLLSTRN